MAYAYYLYDSPGPGQTPLGLTAVPILHVPPKEDTPDRIYRERLLPLLLSLRDLHPGHIPILLLLACTYYALGDFQTSLSISHHILSLDSGYVEAMSNIGTTMKALGQTDKAYEWWWKALQLRPTYWDALDNILGMTFTLAHDTPDQGRRLAHYRQALVVCQYVQRHVLSTTGRLAVTLQPGEIPRLQRAVFTSGTICATLGPTDLDRAFAEYARAIELVIRPHTPSTEGEQYTLRDILLAACAAGHIMCANASHPGLPGISGILQSQLGDPASDFLHAVRASSEELYRALLRAGGGVLPTPLLLPEQASRLPALLFARSHGVLPAICTRGPTGACRPPPARVRQQTDAMTSTVLLTLAKRFQDGALGGAVLPNADADADAGSDSGGGGLRVSTSVVVLLYYLALAWQPTPSTYNNLGIVLSGVADARTGADGEPIDGVGLARMYYAAGLQMDPKHPHLLTNLGSLLKDQGHTDQAIKLYTKAVEQKPDFDIALANLGNAIKDAGRPWDAIPYYRRAARASPALPEAVCGLANSLGSICDWRGRGAAPGERGGGGGGGADAAGRAIGPGSHADAHAGWIVDMLAVTDGQIELGYAVGAGVGAQAQAQVVQKAMEECLRALAAAQGRVLTPGEVAHWTGRFQRLAGGGEEGVRRRVNEAGFLLRFVDWVQPRMQRQWYVRAYGKTLTVDKAVALSEDNLHELFLRPTLPKTLQPPPVPSVLPFHTFTYPLTPRVTRLIPHRSALRISYTAFVQPWLPKHVYRPPRPPVNGKINVGYISNDVNNHPLSHLMQSAFGMHDRARFAVFLYTTSAWDGTAYRPRIAGTVEHCVDVSAWPLRAIVEHIAQHEIHILINLGGYTKGARNDIFAARPCPIQMQLMGYAGTLGAGWCDYLICDPIACPQETSSAERWRRRRAQAAGPGTEALEEPLDMGADMDPETDSDEWLYTEKFIYMPHTFMVTDHKQSFRGDEDLSPEQRAQVPAETLWLDEERRRADARKQVFPDLPQDVIVFANFNQLYKIDPGIFLVWLRILRRVPRSVLWLLRFPAAGEEHLLRSARMWAGDEVAARIRFTDVAKKDWHVFRARVADLFLDTAECNAHTIAADVLWTGTPILTWPKHTYKMCSRVAASMVNATGFGELMTVHSVEEYEERAVELACGMSYVPHHESMGAVLARGQGELVWLRRNIFLNRDRMPLFDTLRWTRNLEKGLQEAWRRWVQGTQYEMSDEWEACEGEEKASSCIWIRDDDPMDTTQHA
ncbi:TPR-like protein [Trametes meyenii]|nr:TPR-like protein [Trametes meyenii]